MSQLGFDEAMNQVLSTLPGVYRSIQGMRLKIARESGVSRNQMDILSTLAVTPAMSVTAMAKALVIAKPNVSLMVNELLEKGFVEKAPDPRDGRVTLFRLSEAGVATRAHLRALISSAFRTALADLTSRELEALKSGMAILSDVVGKVVANPDVEGN